MLPLILTVTSSCLYFFNVLTELFSLLFTVYFFCTGLNLTVFTKSNKNFHVFSYEVRLFFVSLTLGIIIKYLLTETSGKQYVLWILDCRCFPRLFYFIVNRSGG